MSIFHKYNQIEVFSKCSQMCIENDLAINDFVQMLDFFDKL